MIIEYIVTTQEGQVVSSVPTLPLIPEHLTELNRLKGSDRQWPYLFDLNLGFVHCEVTNINTHLDIVTHRLFQQS